MKAAVRIFLSGLLFFMLASCWLLQDEIIHYPVKISNRAGEEVELQITGHEKQTLAAEGSVELIFQITRYDHFLSDYTYSTVVFKINGKTVGSFGNEYYEFNLSGGENIIIAKDSAGSFYLLNDVKDIPVSLNITNSSTHAIAHFEIRRLLENIESIQVLFCPLAANQKIDNLEVQVKSYELRDTVGTDNFSPLIFSFENQNFSFLPDDLLKAASGKTETEAKKININMRYDSSYFFEVWSGDITERQDAFSVKNISDANVQLLIEESPSPAALSRTTLYNSELQQGGEVTGLTVTHKNFLYITSSGTKRYYKKLFFTINTQPAIPFENFSGKTMQFVIAKDDKNLFRIGYQ